MGNSSLGSIFVEEVRYRHAIAFSSSPIVAVDGVLDLSLLDFLILLDLSHQMPLFSLKQLILSEDQISISSASLRLRNGKLSASKVSFALGVLEVSDIPVLIDVYRDLD